MTTVRCISLCLISASLAAAQDFTTVVKPEPIAARLMDTFQVRKRLGVSPEYDAARNLAALKVAILDFGFEGLDPARKQLPPSTVLIEHYPEEFVRANQLGDPGFKKGFLPGNSHGRLMAQIIWATTNFAPDGPKFYLLNANGPTMFRRAVRYAVQEKVDLILFCNSFEGLGNFDGKGPINDVVDEAARAGIIWINAAGNYGRRTYNGAVKIGPDGFLEFAGGRDFLRFRNNLDENTITVTLNWNSYAEAEDAGTTKDLDLFVQDPDGNTIGKSDAVQVPGGETTRENETRNPRERTVLTELPASHGRDYLIRIRAASRNWEPGDRLRVLVTASREAPYLDPVSRIETNPVEFIDASGVGEIFPPADHPRVITVGDASASSSIGPTADSRVKPDVLIEDSQAVFSNGESSYGSSNAAAYFAGIVCLMKATEPGLTTMHLLQLISSRSRASEAAANWPPQTTRRVLTVGKNTRITISAYAPTTSSPVAVSRARVSAIGPVVAAVERYDPRLQASETSDGRYAITIDRSPADLTALFPQFPQDKARVVDDYEFYLAVGQRSGTTRVIDYFRRKGSGDAPPWQAIGGKATDWVEIRKQTTAASPVSARLATMLARRLWKTPTKAELRAAVAASAPSAVATTTTNSSPPPPPKPGR